MATVQQPTNTSAPVNSGADNIRSIVKRLSDKTKHFLPKDVMLDTFTEFCVMAFETSKDLYLCTEESIEKAINFAARDGLYPDGIDASFTWRSGGKVQGADGKDIWIKVVVYTPMVKGVIKNLIRYSDVATVAPDNVYSNDKISIKKGTNPVVEHEIALTNRGEYIGTYCVFTLKDNSQMIEWMSKEDIETVMNSQRPQRPSEDWATKNPKWYQEALDKHNNWQPTNIWQTWFGEMAKKTVIRRLAKLVAKREGYFEYYEDDSQPKQQIEQPQTLEPAYRMPTKQEQEMLTGAGVVMGAIIPNNKVLNGDEF